MKFGEQIKTLLDECSVVLSQLKFEDVEEFKYLLRSADRIFFVGIGRVGLMISAAAVRFGHLGLKCYIVGQLGIPPIRSADLLVAASGSGESHFPCEIAKIASRIGAKVVYLGTNVGSTLSKIADLSLRFNANTKLELDGEVGSQQLLTSLFEQTLLLFCDAVALDLATEAEMDANELWSRHSNLE